MLRITVILNFSLFADIFWLFEELFCYWQSFSCTCKHAHIFQHNINAIVNVSLYSFNGRFHILFFSLNCGNYNSVHPCLLCCDVCVTECVFGVCVCVWGGGGGWVGVRVSECMM